MDDTVLWTCNETELLEMARVQGFQPLKRGLPKTDLVAILRGERLPRQDEISGTAFTRYALNVHINRYWGQIASQLPGCNGQCVTFPCSEGRHAACFYPNEQAILLP